MKNFEICQNDEHKSAAYETYAMTKNAKYGFVTICIPFDFVSHVSFDNLDDLVSLIDEDGVDNWEDLLTMKVGESVNKGDNIWMRVW